MLIHKFRAKRLFSPYFQHFKKVIDSKCFRKTKRNLIKVSFFLSNFFSSKYKSAFKSVDKKRGLNYVPISEH